METIGWGFYGWLPLLVCAAIALAAFLCLRRGGGGICPCMAFRPGRRTPLDILEERFARGEIGKEEFEERQRVLVEPPDPAAFEAATRTRKEKTR